MSMSHLSLKVMSYNIHHGEGMDGMYDIQRIAKVIQNSDAELIGLQEVDRYYSDRSHYEDSIALLGKELGMHWCYGANVIEPPEQGHKEQREYGIAILSKHKIVSHIHHPLSSDIIEQRGLLSAMIDVQGTELYFHCTHLGLEEQERLSQVKEVLDFTRQQPGPCIIAGDFNAQPEDPEVAVMNAVYQSAFQDEFHAHTFPAGDANETIDYIFINEQVQYRDKGSIVHSIASDHYPIIATIAVPVQGKNTDA
ncbi:endonuclease/exonuclease/phosphatase family protein [Paenibacillus sp. 1001270B_150601_E10]|uniref:endonuclease/exonuclease/phosphatase family protein n=1 Tax=Paenibacillus sp. 1001270B_150601_E10 TaxID=2787079 RepID=UPI00189C9296|nr:endonuclease/exonuclease/phosphatase family protein [Paenibacillus sp. 1001270B_150601_E10]